MVLAIPREKLLGRLSVMKYGGETKEDVLSVEVNTI